MSTGAKITFSSCVGVVLAFLEYLLGGWDGNIIVLVILMGIDFAMGLVAAAFFGKSDKSRGGGLSSSACRRGIIKKLSTLLVVAAAYQADRLIGIDFTRRAVIIGFCVSEIISVCENARVMEILPDEVNSAFDRFLDILKKRTEDKENEDKK